VELDVFEIFNLARRIVENPLITTRAFAAGSKATSNDSSRIVART
jgi:hypothetical protein